MTAARLAAAALATLALLCADAWAQPPGAIGDVARGSEGREGAQTGTLSGRAVDSEGAAVADVPVTLITFQPTGQQGLTRSTTDAEGRFAFAPLETNPAIVYFVVVESGGVHHSWRTAFEPGSETVEVEVKVAPTARDTAAVTRGSSDVAVERSCSGLRVLESHHFSNPTESVIFVAETERDGAEPLLEIELPENAGPISNRFGAAPSGLAREGRRVRFWGPLYPGDQALGFSYEIEAADGGVRATWRYPEGTGATSLLAAPSVPGAKVVGLAADAGSDTTATRRFSAPQLEPGASVTLEVAVGEAPPLATVREAQVWIELDDAALSVDEHLALEPQADATDASRLCVALPPDAMQLRFSQATLALPVARDTSGALELSGPLPDGESVITISYQLPVGDAGAQYARSFGVPLPLLGVLVSDTGVRPHTTRLHRRRPARRVERNYLHLEGFEIAPEERLEIGFERLPAPRGLPASVGTGFAIALATGLVAFLGAPLRSGSRARDPGESRADYLAAERAGVYAAIVGLDEDFDTGKLTAEDHQVLRDELRSHAVALLDAERRAGAAEPEPAAAPPDTNTVAEAAPCPGCRSALPAGARFCPHCGVRLGSGEEDG